MTRYPITAIPVAGMVIRLEPTCEAGAALVAQLEAALQIGGARESNRPDRCVAALILPPGTLSM